MNRLDFQALLQARFPGDYSEAFALLEVHRDAAPEAGKTEQHHICPRKQFPEYEFGYPGNLIDLPIAVHHRIHEHYGTANSALIVNARWLSAGSAITLKQKGGRAAAAACKKNGTGLWDPETRRKGIETQRKNGTGFYDPAMQRLGGTARAAKARQDSTGMYAPDFHEKAAQAKRERGTSVIAAQKAYRTQRKKGTGIFSAAAKEKQLATMRNNESGIFSASARSNSTATARTPEARKRMSDLKRGTHYNLGCKHNKHVWSEKTILKRARAALISAQKALDFANSL